jgi:NAD(P)H-nitrite reductase large subunit
LARAFPWPHALAAGLPDAAVLCRCEGVTAGEVRRCVREKDSLEINRAKAFSRIGMGRCQGRYCGLSAATILAGTAGEAPAAAMRLRGQAPVKPVPLRTQEGGA